jgi:hypothetical protein
LDSSSESDSYSLESDPCPSLFTQSESASSGA